MLKIIFLDFDGVLDNAHYDMMLKEQDLARSDKYGSLFDPICVANLASIIEATGTKIVVSSDWKYIMSFMKLLDMWEARNLPGDIIGTTPSNSLHRGDEIDEWLQGRDEDVEYVILDDMDANSFKEEQLPRLLVVNPYSGLDEGTVNRAISILNKDRNTS